jgi:hypothetical protein
MSETTFQELVTVRSGTASVVFPSLTANSGSSIVTEADLIAKEAYRSSAGRPVDPLTGRQEKRLGRRSRGGGRVDDSPVRTVRPQDLVRMVAAGW